MFPHEVEKNIDKLSWGKKYIKVKNGFDKDLYLIIKTPDLRDRNWINFIYEDSLKSARNEKIFTEKELEKELELRGIWGPPQENLIKSLESQIKEIESELSKSKDGGREHKRFIKSKKVFEKKLNELIVERTVAFSICAERWAELNRMHALIFCSTLDSNEKKYWTTWEDFGNESDFDLISNIAAEINNNKLLTEKELRFIARSPQWRFKWNGAKNCGNLFGKPLVELDLEQQALVYWSQVYDSAYEAYERPSDEIINNDEKLDKWFEKQAEKKKIKKKNEKNEEKIGNTVISERIRRHGEIFVVVNSEINPNAPTIEEVEKMNSPSVKNWKNQQLDKVEERGHINEKELRPAGDRESRGLINSSDAIMGNYRKTKMGTTRDVKSKHPGGSIKPGRQ